MLSFRVQMKFGLNQKEWSLLNDLLIQPLKKHSVQVWVFGSRARGDHAKFSDIDVLYSIPTNVKLPDNFIFHIKDDLENSNLPYKVDLVCESEAAKNYLPSILKDRVEV